ncbi:MAG: imidazole glycerol phosphate synthase subunit HisF [Terasakiella sp.]|uniref:imidazole glycerol phosphate synthase subunit HisF n=1 Tax=unclassified Terasakiella TaxID=2614952 RepID=UPI003B0039BE
MPSKRVIANIILYQGMAVQSIGFERYLPIGKPEVAARFLSEWGADEIVLLDIEASIQGRTIDPDVVERTAAGCFVPLAVGGGLQNVEQMQTMLRHGADKIVVNTAIHKDRAALRAAIDVLGSQCLVASIDVRKQDNSWEAYVANGKNKIALSLSQIVKQVVDNGFGELMINSIDRDGRQNGYDLDLIDAVGKELPIPLICVGGAGHPNHMIEAISMPCVSAVAAANFLHYQEHSIAVIKGLMREKGIDIRHGSQADYRESVHDERARISKIDDCTLDSGVFEYLPDEKYDLL